MWHRWRDRLAAAAARLKTETGPLLVAWLREEAVRQRDELRRLLRDGPAPGPDGALARSRLLIMTMALVMLAFLLWTSIGRLEVVSEALGEVTPASQVKSVQHLEGGIVAEILVKEGEKVAVDQPLVVLESVASGADVGELTRHMAGLRIDIARLEAEAAGGDAPVFPADLQAVYPQMVAQSLALLSSRRDKYDAAMKSQREAVTQRQEFINEVQARLRNNRDALRMANEQIKISEDLLKMQLTNRLNHLALLREQTGLKSKIDEDVAGLKRAEAAVKEGQAQLQGIVTTYQEDVKNQLSKAKRDLGELSERLKKYSDNLSRTTLRAPVAGLVKTVYVATQGGVVLAGKTVVDIVPSEDHLIVEAKLPIYDVGYVKAGQVAYVRLASTDGNRFGAIAGKVLNVSPDSIVTEKGAYYKVKIETQADRFRHGGTEYLLVPGIQVETHIVTGSRTILDYILDPLRGYASTALRER